MQLPLFLKNPLTSLLGSKCYTSLIENLNIFDASCRNLAISKGLGLGIVVGGSIVKVPQVLKIVNAHSAEGLSLASSLLETSGYIISLAYNVRAGNPFSTYGETMFIAIQNVIILSLIFFYTNRSVLGYLFPVIYLGASMILADATLVGATNMSYLQISTIPIVAFSRAPQIYQNWKNGSTGQLSAFTVFMFFAGAMARIFTTLQEVDDNLILFGFVLGAFFNGILLFQMVLYWNSKPKKIGRHGVSPKQQRVRKID